MYKIILPNFQGPFDLLLYFIKRDELNIYNIPIAKITEEFHKYIQIMKIFDLELAGEFLVMAATLMYIKSQMLLPRSEEEAEGEPEDPRTQLVQRLIEYKQFKSASQELASLAEEQRYVYYRSLFENSIMCDEEKDNTAEEFSNANLFSLINAFKKALDRTDSQTTTHVVQQWKITIDEKYNLIRNALRNRASISFFHLVRNNSRPHIIVTFLAILEMIKTREIFIHQDASFEDIIISLTPVMSYN